jgi:hypothetical protein
MMPDCRISMRAQGIADQVAGDGGLCRRLSYIALQNG